MKQKASSWLYWFFYGFSYVLSHILFLTKLPVFADEAIYIRWAQLILDDAPRYLFFSMADGKPPLFMWLLSLVLPFFSDPLFAGRLFSIVVGLLTALVAVKIVRTLSPEEDGWATAMSIMLLPFWFFLHRMALMDGLLTLCIALSVLCTLLATLSLTKKGSLTKRSIGFTLAAGVSFGAGLLTKTPALFAVPVLLCTGLYRWVFDGKRSVLRALTIGGTVAFVCIIGLALFASLRVSPLFGALFSRSGDFTFTVSELMGGEWKYALTKSAPRNLAWIGTYLSWGFIALTFLGLFTKQRKNILFLLGLGLLFFIPLTMFGRVLYPRYFLPAAFFVTLAGGMSISALLKKTLAWKIITIILIQTALMSSARFMWHSYTSVAAIPFVDADVIQYLSEWSAGFGNTEVRDFIYDRQQAVSGTDTKIVVLTEGSFGTLPDGLLMYFHKQETAKNIEIHGIGVARGSLPEEYTSRVGRDEVYYMVNDHRLSLSDLSTVSKVLEVKRPHNGPSLLLFQVKPLQESSQP